MFKEVTLTVFLMKVHFKQSKIINRLSRKYYADWVKPLFPTMRQELYGIKKKDLFLSKTPEEADILILPLTWNYYFDSGKAMEAYKIIENYERYHKPIITWVSGDFKYKIKEGNFVLLQHNLYKSEQKKNEYAYPAIIRDPFEYIKTFGLIISSANSKNSISFCGTANRTIFDKYENFCKEFIFKIKNTYFKSYLDLNMPISGMALREKCLKSFKQNTNLATKIIVRKKKESNYISRQQYRFEYWNNMLSSPFTLCIRGNGNFSVRFYETLALGRIPVLFNTDCVLPLDKFINWSEHCIIIENKDPKNFVKSVELLIRAMDHNKIVRMQINNRKLWIEMLSFGGFYYTFANKILKNRLK